MGCLLSRSVFSKRCMGLLSLTILDMSSLDSTDKKPLQAPSFVRFRVIKRVFKYGGCLMMAYQGLRANNLVMWEGIKWYSQKGIKVSVSEEQSRKIVVSPSLNPAGELQNRKSIIITMILENKGFIRRHVQSHRVPQQNL